MAFVSSTLGGAAVGVRTSVAAVTVMAAAEQPPRVAAPVSRRAALQSLSVAALASVAAAAAAPVAAMADPIFNRGELKLSKDNVVIDEENISSRKVLDGYKKLVSYREQLAVLQADYSKDQQMAVIPRIREIFEISALRTALNQANQLFDEDTQKKTDAVIRGVIQDISEIENYAVLKPDIPRTPRRIEKTTLWMNKLGADLDKILAFQPGK